jgi:hypothetical protein
MRVSLALLVLSLAAFGVTEFLPVYASYQPLAGLLIIGSLALGYVTWRNGRVRNLANLVIVDGSNVMYWRTGDPDLKCVRDVVKRLKKLGHTPGVMFDANAGYLLVGGYRHDSAFARSLGLPEDRIMVVPKGTPADEYILRAARDMGARIVTNDQFRDWVERHPEIRNPGYLIKGEYRQGKLWMDLGPQSARARDQTVSR